MYSTDSCILWHVSFHFLNFQLQLSEGQEVSRAWKRMKKKKSTKEVRWEKLMESQDNLFNGLRRWGKTNSRLTSESNHRANQRTAAAALTLTHVQSHVMWCMQDTHVVIQGGGANYGQMLNTALYGAPACVYEGLTNMCLSVPPETDNIGTHTQKDITVYFWPLWGKWALWVITLNWILDPSFLRENQLTGSCHRQIVLRQS